MNSLPTEECYICSDFFRTTEGRYFRQWGELVGWCCNDCLPKLTVYEPELPDTPTYQPLQEQQQQAKQQDMKVTSRKLITFNAVKTHHDDFGGKPSKSFQVYEGGHWFTECTLSPAEGMTEWDAGPELRARFGEESLDGHKTAAQLKNGILEAQKADRKVTSPQLSTVKNKREWTEEEIKMLSQAAFDNSEYGALRGLRGHDSGRLHAVARKLGRTYASVKMKAKRLEAASYAQFGYPKRTRHNRGKH